MKFLKLALFLIPACQPEPKVREFLDPVDITIESSTDDVKPLPPSVWDYKIAEYYTRYKFKGSDKNRAHNVETAAKRLHNIVINPGEVFSFNENVGIRTKKNGFLEAPVIFNGTLEDDIGGGVCQVSSTLYTTVLSSGLKIIERSPHTRTSTYINPGLDATVVFPAECEKKPNCYKLDFKFKNTSGYKIGIKSFIFEEEGKDSRILFFGLYSLKKSETRISFNSWFKWGASFNKKYIRINGKPAGYSRKIQKGVREKKVVLKITTEKLIDKKWEVVDVKYRNSKYPPVTEVWEVWHGFQY